MKTTTPTKTPVNKAIPILTDFMISHLPHQLLYLESFVQQTFVGNVFYLNSQKKTKENKRIFSIRTEYTW